LFIGKTRDQNSRATKERYEIVIQRSLYISMMVW